MTSFRLKMLRLVGVIQIIIALILISLLVVAYSNRSTISSIFVSLADTVAKTADTVSLVAKEVESKQTVLDNAKTALANYRKAAGDLNTVSNDFLDLVPKYEDTMRKSAETVRDFSKTFSDMSAAMRFEIPVIKKCPLEKPADQIADLAERMKDIATSFDETADFLKNSTPKLKNSINSTCDSTGTMLDAAIDSISNIQNKSLKDAFKNLDESANNLRSVSSRLNRTHLFLRILFLLGLVLAVSIGISGVTSFMIASSLHNISIPSRTVK